MGYLQTSTANPYGHRPWATMIYTGVDNYGFLKQPQNTILREDLRMRPEIYKPPELKPRGMSGITRRRRGGLGLLPAYLGPPARYPGAPASFLRMAPPQDGTAVSYLPAILPPSIVPPVPQPVYSAPGGVVYALPGDTTVPGSPFAPPAPGELMLPASAPPVAAAATSSLSQWISAQDYIPGVSNGILAAVAIGGLFFLLPSGKKRRR